MSNFQGWSKAAVTMYLAREKHRSLSALERSKTRAVPAMKDYEPIAPGVSLNPHMGVGSARPQPPCLRTEAVIFNRGNCSLHSLSETRQARIVWEGRVARSEIPSQTLEFQRGRTTVRQEICPLFDSVVEVNNARNREITVVRQGERMALREADQILATGSAEELTLVLNAKDNRGEYVIPARPKSLMGTLDGDAEGSPSGHGDMWGASLAAL